MYILLLLIFLLLSVLSAGIEVAFVSASRLRMELRKRKEIKRGGILAHFYENSSHFLYTIQWGHYFFLSLVFGTLLLWSASGGSYVPLGFVSYLVFALLFLILVEIIIKTVFRIYAEPLLYFFAYPAYLLYWFFFIPARLSLVLTNFAMRLIFKKPPEEEAPYSHRIDLESFVLSSQPEAEMGDIDTTLFGRALNLRDIRARDCMVPRMEIEYIDASASLRELEKLFQKTGLSRIIVIEKELDDVLGYVHHQQLLREPDSIRQIVMDLPFVPEVMRGIDLLNKFINERINISGVVDEFGVVKGVITLEDIMEKLIGEIDDEHDEEAHLELKLSDDTYLFSGRLEIDYLNEKYPDLDFPKGNYRTLSGYLVMTTEIIPKPETEITLGDYLFILQSVTETKIETVRVIKLQ